MHASCLRVAGFPAVFALHGSAGERGRHRGHGLGVVAVQRDPAGLRDGRDQPRLQVAPQIGREAEEQTLLSLNDANLLFLPEQELPQSGLRVPATVHVSDGVGLLDARHLVPLVPPGYPSVAALLADRRSLISSADHHPGVACLDL